MKNAAPRPGHETVNPESNSMSPPDSPWLRHHRQRWLRHDAHLWIRPDAARFFPPGTDPAVINPTLPRKPDAAKAAAFEAELAAEVAAGYRLLAVLRDEVAELRAELKRRRELEAKYSPSQPRVPSGNPRGGQWTDRSGGGGTVAGPSQDAGQSQDADLTQPMGNVDLGDVSGSSELGDLFRIKPDGPRTDAANLSDSIGKIAADDSDRRYSVNLREEEVRGHTLGDHSRKSDLELEAEFKRRGYDTPYVSFVPRRLGSFASDESANDLVNRTLERNKATVDMVASGELQDAFVKARFGFITGREIFRPDPSERYYYFRPTYGVGVDIRHDPGSSRGYRVHTAYPRND
jgi:hypothetical protein